MSKTIIFYAERTKGECNVHQQPIPCRFYEPFFCFFSAALAAAAVVTENLGVFSPIEGRSLLPFIPESDDEEDVTEEPEDDELLGDGDEPSNGEPSDIGT